MATRDQKISRAMRTAWRIGNRVCFDNKLPRPAFRVDKKLLKRDTAQALWHVENGKQIIKVDPSAVKNARYLIRLMLHEMVHQFQWQQKSERTRYEQHGRFFQRHCKRIKILTGYDVFWPR
jgi:predicted SprT family Zn-dependent metalloprotease